MMSSTRSRPQRRAAAGPSNPQPPSITVSKRSSRSSRVKSEPEPEPEPELEVELGEADRENEDDDEPLTEPAGDEDEAEEDEEEDEDVEPSGPSRRRSLPVRRKGSAPNGRTKSSVKGKAKASRGSISRQVKEETSEMESRASRTRLKRNVSYKEIPPEEIEDEEEDEDDEPEQVDAEEEQDEEEGDEDEVSPAPDETVATPNRRGRSSQLQAEEEEKKTPTREKIGSGKGGFSVKGAASAAARARWAKFNREKAERGDDDDDGDRKRRSAAGKRESRAAVESFKMGSTMTIKGEEYTVGDDELVMPDDVKGETKIDAEGRLLGGREYKLVTFTSESRRNPDRVYALTIDAARACGYTDSLAFLRRCPQLLKLSCNATEREMLIDIGRVTGNLKHRMVTMVSMRNVFKLMGARLVKGGKWVTDDYYEDECLAKCPEFGFTPYAVAHEDEITANAFTAMERPQQSRAMHFDATISAVKQSNVSPFYTLGGPSTHFAGNGIDPWTDAGWGNKRARLRGMGVTDEDWMWRVAMECRRVDEALKEYRAERIGVLEGQDLKGWVWSTERLAEGTEIASQQANGNSAAGNKVDGNTPPAFSDSLKPPDFARRRSALSREVTFEPDNQAEDEEMEEEAPKKDENAMDVDENDPVVFDDGVDRTPGGKIIVESDEEAKRVRAKWGWGRGNWKAGVIEAVYEPHTHIPHVPLYTQPTSASLDRLSMRPALALVKDTKERSYNGLASVEFVFEGAEGGGDDHEERAREIEAAVEWEKRSREKKRKAAEVS